MGFWEDYGWAQSTRFWGIEVKPGESVICDPGKETYLHISQAALGETKKASENVYLYTKVNDQKLVLGTLSGEKFPQASFDLVFEKEFLLSHSSKSAIVFVCGYKSAMADPESDGFSGTDSESESEPELEPIQLAPKSNGKIVVKEQAKAGKTTSGKVSDNAEPSAKTKSKAEAKSEKPKPEDSDDDDSGDDDESDDDSDSEDQAMPDAGDDSDDEEVDDDDSSDEDVTPKKDEVSKKRAGDSSTKSSGPEKKAKLLTPATKKSDVDGKKGSHAATPYPKQVGKNASNNEKSKQQAPKPSTPKSGGSVTCKSCSKTFNSENALQAHSKAKHEAK